MSILRVKLLLTCFMETSLSDHSNHLSIKDRQSIKDLQSLLICAAGIAGISGRESVIWRLALAVHGTVDFVLLNLAMSV